MPHILQLFKSAHPFKKAAYTPAARQSIKHWPKTLASTSGFVEGNSLILPNSAQKNACSSKSALIILQDWPKDDPDNLLLARSEQSACFQSAVSKCHFEMFSFQQAEPGKIAVYLNYGAKQYVIGLPKRDDHKVADIKPGKAILYAINGKVDGYHQRVFMEYKYLIQYVGQVEEVDFRAGRKMEVIKSLPLEGAKEVNERKILK